MGCINSDGTLTNTAKKVMQVLKIPAVDTEIANQISFPVYLIRSSLRELNEIGLIAKMDENYSLTELGAEYLKNDE